MNQTAPTIPEQTAPPLPQVGQTQGRGFFRRLSVLFCFGILAWLLGRHGELAPPAMGVLVFLALVLSVIGRSLYTWTLAVFNPAIRRNHGVAGIRQGVNTGFLMLIPFTVLAVLAELLLGWNALQAFAAAGFMISGAMAGMELGKLGKQNWFAALLPSLGAAILVGAWMVLLSVALSILQNR